MASRSRFFSALAVGCAVLVASPSWAAMIEPGLGDLTINQGQGFKPVTSPANGNVGDSVMVGPGGSATVVYDDGCRVPVQPGAVSTIAPLSPCAAGSYAADMAVKAPPMAAPAPTEFGYGGAVVALAALGVIITTVVVGSQHHHGTTVTHAASAD